jgi:hypothetical protein
MSATIVEKQDLVEDADDLDTKDSIEATDKAPAAPKEEDEIPEKYRGKSTAEIVRMHAEAEKLLGKQGQELGELRRAADEYIKRTLKGDNPQPNNPEEKVEEVDFFADPQKAVKTMIERDPRIKNAAEAAEQFRRETALRTLMQKHPDALEVAQSEDFQKWVGESRTRVKLYAQADQQFDYDAAEELIGTFKLVKGTAPSKAAEPVKANKNDGKVVPRPVSGGDSAPPSAAKIYRRADIIKLRQTDPKRYFDMAEEIELAYREHRVK